MINSQYSLNKNIYLTIKKGLWSDHEAITGTINYQLVTERGCRYGIERDTTVDGKLAESRLANHRSLQMNLYQRHLGDVAGIRFHENYLSPFISDPVMKGA